MLTFRIGFTGILRRGNLDSVEGSAERSYPSRKQQRGQSFKLPKLLIV